MKAGKHAATEVPAAMTIDDCWALVEAAEKHRRHAVMMENCNYDRPEMLVLNIVQQGLLGDVLHAEGGYLHDLREIKFEKKDEGLWRRAWSRKLDGNPYPTHGLGPDRQLPRHQSRRSLRLHGVDERSVARPAGLGARALSGRCAGAPRALHARRRQHQPDQDRARPHDRRAALHQPAAPVQPHSHGAGHQGDVPGLSQSPLHRGPRQAASVDRVRGDPARSSITRCGAPSKRSRRAPATAAWTSSRTIA